MMRTYAALFFVLQLMRTYAKYVVERSKQEGFVAPTFEEMFRVLILPRSTTRQSIEPLEMKRRDRFQSLRSLSEFDCDMMMDSHSHDPKGSIILKAMGFLPKDDDGLTDRPDLHLEFPMAEGNAYPKFTVKECLCQDSDDEEDDDDDNEVNSMSEFALIGNSSKGKKGIMKSLNTRLQAGGKATEEEIGDSTHEFSVSSDGTELAEILRENDEMMDDECHSPNGGVMQYSDPDGNYDDDDDDDLVANQKVVDTDGPIHDDAGAIQAGRDAAQQLAGQLNPMHLIRDQDMDWRNPNSKGSKITDELERIKNKMHELTWNNFNDRAYHIKDPENSFYFGETKKRERRRTKHLEKKLDKSLGLKSFSNSNPVISRLSLFVEPLVMAIYGFLFAFRAGFNIFTWQDPYLTFLLFVFSSVLSIVLFIIPWRICLFSIGMLLVGPQNWAIRVLREKGILPPVKPKQRKPEIADDGDQHVFHSHKRLDGILGPKPPPDVDPREVQHIVVPYGPFMYQRFYDWPPEQQHATVTLTRNEIPLEPELSNSKMMSSLRSNESPQAATKTRYPRLHRLRNRVKRGKNTGTTPAELQELSQLIELSSELEPSPTNGSKTE
uniref:Translocation protein SEC62 n=1 Tax=Entomoneis paludosa TaxID=265537 RepID=A0A7S2Y4B0_9STRA